tara:strand:+ start:1066 stop:1305 length:240 start_codon:yes stop_codon:yes gene_type:complete
MATENSKKETVIINGEEHNLADLTSEQVTLINHVSDLERKASQINFSLEQTLGARNHFMGLLNQSLEAQEATVDKAVND